MFSELEALWPNGLLTNFGKCPHVNSARLSTTCRIASKYSVDVVIIANTKVVRSQPQLNLGCSRQRVCRRLCCTRGRRGGEPNDSLRLWGPPPCRSIRRGEAASDSNRTCLTVINYFGQIDKVKHLKWDAVPAAMLRLPGGTLT